MLTKALSLAHSQQASAEADLFDELRIESISALSEHRGDVRRNAEWLRNLLSDAGFDAQLVDVAGERHPIVRADRVMDKRLPFLTIYGHYDVQPVDPLDEWDSAPFDPTVKDGMVFARGAADSKANHIAAIKAADYALRAGQIRLNLRFLLEGEEEIVGNALGRYAAENAHDLTTDYLVILDGSFDFDNTPALVTGLRGVLHVELHAIGAASDVHSGVYGGVAPNPLNTLAHVLASLKDRTGRVTIPGFYDGVTEPSSDEREAWCRPSDYAARLLGTLGASALEGEPTYEPVDRQWARPTLDVHGITGGFHGEGVKTVIPSRASAKFSMRLVAGQDVESIWVSLQKYLSELATPGVRLSATRLAATLPLLIDSSTALGKVMTHAYTKSFGKSPRIIRSGGSIPVALDLHSILSPQMIITGFAQPGNAQHSPNEHMSLENFHRGTDAIVELVFQLAEVRR